MKRDAQGAPERDALDAQAGDGAPVRRDAQAGDGAPVRRDAWKRLRWALIALGLALAAHWLLSHVLADREPLAAALLRQYWVVALVAALLLLRLGLLLVIVPWAVATGALAALDWAASRRSRA